MQGDAALDRFDAFFEPNSFTVGGLFPTPLMTASLENHGALNTDLAERITAREQVERGVEISNLGGWHSAEFQTWCGPSGTLVLEAARQMVDRMTVMDISGEFVQAKVGWRIAAWANVNRRGHGNKPHGHPSAFWSGIYWVDDGGVQEDPAVGGLLEIADPRGLLPSMYAPHLRCAVRDCLGDGRGEVVTPRAGTLILFPSWLIHSVSPYTGDRTRISIAFNFSL